MGRAGTRALIGLIFLASFTAYQFSIARSAKRFPEESRSAWHMFGADNMERELRGDWTSVAARKHPLFVPVSSPLFSMASRLFPRIGLAWENYALAFPAALVGAVNVVLMFLLFGSIERRVTPALLTTLLFAVAQTQWVFSSIPETYSLTALTTTLFLIAIVRERSSMTYDRTAVATALACYASPQQLLLGVVPAVLNYFQQDSRRKKIKRLLRYAVIVGVLFVIPYEVFLKVTGLGWQFSDRYLGVYGRPARLLDLHWYGAGLINLVLFSVTGPAVTPVQYSNTVITAIDQASWLWRATAFGYVSVIAVLGSGLHRETASVRQLQAGLAAAVLAYLVFFVYFNPREFYVYTLPCLPVVMLFIYTLYAPRANVAWNTIIVALIVLIAISNWQVLVLLSDF